MVKRSESFLYEEQKKCRRDGRNKTQPEQGQAPALGPMWSQSRESARAPETQWKAFLPMVTVPLSTKAFRAQNFQQGTFQFI